MGFDLRPSILASPDDVLRNDQIAEQGVPRMQNDLGKLGGLRFPSQDEQLAYQLQAKESSAGGRGSKKLVP